MAEGGIEQTGYITDSRLTGSKETRATRSPLVVDPTHGLGLSAGMPIGLGQGPSGLGQGPSGHPSYSISATILSLMYVTSLSLPATKFELTLCVPSEKS